VTERTRTDIVVAEIQEQQNLIGVKFIVFSLGFVILFRVFM